MRRKYAKLRGKIKEIYDTQEAFAKALSMSDSCLRNKLDGKVDWKLTEVIAACGLLNIPISEAHEIFLD